MNKESFFYSEQGNQYVYSDVLRYFLYIPDALKSVMKEKMFSVTGGADDYYMRKFCFLQKHRFFKKEEIDFQTEYTEEQVKQNMASLRQLLIEVTDSCNLKCKYCGYGEYYSNYDQRETCSQTFNNVKIVIDYLVDLWKSDYNVSHNNTVTIGFYGGEPLLNMKLIKETIAYVESLNITHLKFTYNMTTNGMLLDRNMDYLVQKKFTLLISLDGNEYQSSYRVDKYGKPSFSRIVKNILKLKDKYSEFFEEKVNFNAVLHDRNSVEECYRSINDMFGKIPHISELNTNGIIPERISEFVKMFNSKPDSFKAANEYDDIKKAFYLDDADSVTYHKMLMNYGGNWHETFLDLFGLKSVIRYIPTGTCRPFERKLFLTVHGKILPCEKIGHGYAIATLIKGKLNLDCEAVAKYYSSMYKKVIGNCSRCHLKRTCGQCLFLLKEKDGRLICPGIQTDAKLRKEFSTFLTYAEQNPGDYERLLSSIVID